MKKICYIVTIPLTIKAFFIRQLKYLADNGFDVSVVCSPDNNLQCELGEKIKFIPVEIPRGLSVLGSILAIKRIYRIFKKEYFDLIQYSTPNAAFYSSIAGKLAGVKNRNYHLMGFKYLGANGFSRLIFKVIEKITCKFSTSIECVSNSNLKLGIDEGIFKPNKATVIWNGSTGGIDLERFDYSNRNIYRNEIREKYHIGKNEFVYGFVGRITRDKGVNEILEAFNSIDNAKLMLVGDIDDRDSLNNTLYENSLKDLNVIYISNVNDVEKYYCAMDVLLLPSYREGFGNVIIEAAAMGTPAIVSDIPGPIDAIEENQTAIKVQPNDAEELAYEMREFVKKDYINMGKEAHIFVSSNFNSDILNEYILKRKKELLIE